MARVYDCDEVHAALPWERLAAALERAFREGAQVPVRHAHPLSPGHTLLLMPAWDAELIATKIVTVIPGAAHTVQASVVVLDRRTGDVLALMDGEALTLRRTAATSALAATRLARPDARTLLVVGSGRLAEWMARAHVALQPGLERVVVWGRRAEPARRVALAIEGTLRGTHAGRAVAVEVSESLEPAVRSADLVCCATTSTEPIVKGAWIQPGTHLDLVGGFRRDMREVDDEAVRRARVVVDTYAGALAEAGDLTQPIERGVIDRNHVRAELAELLAEPVRGRARGSDITLFKSVGTALEDLAAARCVLEG